MVIGETKRGFKRKTIIETIENKVQDWISTLPKELGQKVNENYILTGGAIPSMLMGDLPNDYDFYFKNSKVVVELAEYYLKDLVANNSRIGEISVEDQQNRVRIKIKSAGFLYSDINNNNYQYFESLPQEEISKYFKSQKYIKETSAPKYKAHYISENCISLDGDIQIVLRFIGTPEEIHKTYDFVHTTSYYTSEDGLVLKQEALESILSKELKYIGSKYPVCSMFRMRKFIKRGWTINAGEMFKIAYDISKLNLNDMNVLHDQLIGVDTAYFSELLSVLNKQTNKDIDRTYLFEVVNRVFDETL